MKDGPYQVSGGVPLHDEAIGIDDAGDSVQWVRGQEHAVAEGYTLCRCGHSQNPPFCDGSHIAARFDGKETAGRESYEELAERFNGPAIELTDVAALCSYARFCDRAGTVWRLVEQSGDPEAKATAIQEACDCPSGRLVVWEKSGEPIEPDLEPSIAVVSDPLEGGTGPLWVRGGIAVESADGTEYETRNRVTLCRCGKSRNKPFCDGSHAGEPQLPG
jgi:CDGSH-type Zn-finger protein